MYVYEMFQKTSFERISDYLYNFLPCENISKRLFGEYYDLLAQNPNEGPRDDFRMVLYEKQEYEGKRVYYNFELLDTATEENSVVITLQPIDDLRSVVASNDMLGHYSYVFLAAHILFELAFNGPNQEREKLREMLSEAIKKHKNEDYIIQREPCPFCNGEAPLPDCSVCDRTGMVDVKKFNDGSE